MEIKRQCLRVRERVLYRPEREREREGWNAVSTRDTFIYLMSLSTLINGPNNLYIQHASLPTNENISIRKCIYFHLLLHDWFFPSCSVLLALISSQHVHLTCCQSIGFAKKPLALIILICGNFWTTNLLYVVVWWEGSYNKIVILPNSHYLLLMRCTARQPPNFQPHQKCNDSLDNLTSPTNPILIFIIIHHLWTFLSPIMVSYKKTVTYLTVNPSPIIRWRNKWTYHPV